MRARTSSRPVVWCRRRTPRSRARRASRHDLARHRVRDDRQPARLERRRAASPTRSRNSSASRSRGRTVRSSGMRRRPLCGLRQDREPRRHDGIFSRSQAFLISSSCARGRGGGRKMPSGSLCRPVSAAWFDAEYADEAVELVVVRLDVVVGDRPVVAEAVDDSCAGSRQARSAARCGPSGGSGHRACGRGTTATRLRPTV